MYAWDRPTFWRDPSGHAPGDWWDPRSYVGDNDYARGWRQGLKEGYFDNAADVGDSLGALGRGAGKAGVRLATGVVSGAVKGGEQSSKLLFGTLSQKAEVIQEDLEMGKAAVTQFRENASLLGYGLTHGNDLLNAAADLGISGTSEVLGDATFQAGNVVAAGYGAYRGVQGIAMDAAHDAALTENAARAARAAMDAAHDAAIAYDRSLLAAAAGDSAEELVVARLQAKNYTGVIQIQNASNQGIDLVGRAPNGIVDYFEIKANSAAMAPAQRSAGAFIRSRLEAAVSGQGRWANVTQDVRDAAQTLLDELDSGKPYNAYKVRVKYPAGGAQGPPAVSITEWKKK